MQESQESSSSSTNTATSSSTASGPTIPTHASTVSTSSPIPRNSISCQQPRLSGAPLGDQLRSGLTSNNAIQTICQTSFTSQNTLTITFNNAYYFISVTRRTANQTLQWCTSGLNAIILSCIVNKTFFGGLFTQGDELYNISNSGYPDNQDPLQIHSSTSLVRTGYISR